MTDAVPWVKWHFDKWRGDPGLRKCSLAARGLWMELLCVMHEATPYGYLAVNMKPLSERDVMQFVGSSSIKEVKRLLCELRDAGVFSETSEGVIYCRRLVRDHELREKSRVYGKEGGNPALKKPPGGVNPTRAEGVGLPLYPEKEREKEKEKTPSSLRSDGVNGHGGLFPEPPPPPPSDDPKTQVYRDGKAILAKLGVKAEPGAMITKWLALLHGDALGLAEIFYAAEREKPVGAVAWIQATVKARGGGTPRDDPWGIRTWLRRQPDTRPGKHATTGAEVTCINGFPVEEMAMEIAEAARLPETWRGNWDAFGAWMREELVTTSESIEAIRRQAKRMTEPIHSIAVFDRVIRGAGVEV